MTGSELPNIRQNAAEELRENMETQARTVRELVLRQPPVQLLGYLMGQFHMAIMPAPDGSEKDPSPNKDAIATFQFALEYVHAVWSGSANLPEHQQSSMNTRRVSLWQCWLSSEPRRCHCIASSATKTEFRAKSAWTLLRGHR